MRIPPEILVTFNGAYSVSGKFIAVSFFKQDKLLKSESLNIIAWKNAFGVAFAWQSGDEPSRSQPEFVASSSGPAEAGRPLPLQYTGPNTSAPREIWRTDIRPPES